MCPARVAAAQPPRQLLLKLPPVKCPYLNQFAQAAQLVLVRHCGDHGGRCDPLVGRAKRSQPFNPSAGAAPDVQTIV